MLNLPEKTLFHASNAVNGASWTIDYHGVAGFTIRAEQTTVVLDPFVSRPGLFASAFKRLTPNVDLVRDVFPVADAVACGHAHHDHILDAPTVCSHTGAQFIGSPDAANVARAAGIPEDQITETLGREDLRIRNATLRGIPSRHGRVYGNRVPLPGSIPTPPPWPPRIWDLRHGLVLNWGVNLGGVRVVHIDSADFIDEEFDGVQADVVCLCAIGRKYRPNYVEAVVDALRPRWIIPCHWDWFFTPYGAPARFLPGVDLPGFLSEIRDAGVTPVPLDIGGQFALSPQEIPG